MLHGFGLKLRHEYYDDFLISQDSIDWLEVLTENYLDVGGYHFAKLKEFSKLYPITMHGVSMSLGGCDELDFSYLSKVRDLANEIHPKIISDHICFNKVDGIYTHDLLPLPYTKESITNVVNRIQQVQEFLGSKIAVENVSSYVTFNDSVMPEYEFVSEICDKADCNLLLDINNIYVSSINHQFPALEYIRNIPLDRVVEIHLAGHSASDNFLIDTHDNEVCYEVWDLYRKFCKLKSDVPLLLERDDNLPRFDMLINELNIARKISNE